MSELICYFAFEETLLFYALVLEQFFGRSVVKPVNNDRLHNGLKFYE